MEHMHRVTDPHGIDRAEGVAPVAFHQFIHARAQPLPRFGRIRRSPQLDDEQRHAHVLLHVERELLEILFRRALPIQDRSLCFYVKIIPVQI